MTKYIVLKPITEKGQLYKEGDRIELTNERARQLGDSVAEEVTKENVVEKNKSFSPRASGSKIMTANDIRSKSKKTSPSSPPYQGGDCPKDSYGEGCLRTSNLEL